MAFHETDERTEPATPRKRQEARERGQVARSHDLAGALVLLAAVAALQLFGRESLGKLSGLTRHGLRSMHELRWDTAGALQAAGAALIFCLEVLLPLGAILFAAALAANLFQVGFLMTGQPLVPDASRLNPFLGLRRILSGRGFLRGVLGTFKVAVVGTLLASTLWGELVGPHSPGAAVLLGAPLGQAAAYSLDLVVELGLKIAAALLALALLDYGLQRWFHERDLRMTRGEVKEELRRMEGDPRVRERRRRVQAQLARHSMMREVARARVVVTNPTHLAVAIRYDEKRMAAPRLAARGEGYLAQRIRETALEHGIPVVERRELARALYRAAEVGEEVPRHLYKAVAEVLAFVDRLPRRLQAAGAGSAASGQPVGAGAAGGERWGER